jgi:hypothetical protein
MERWLPLVLLAAVFLGLLGLRVAFLLILRRGERGPRDPTRRWPDATVIRDRPENPSGHSTPDPP